MLCVVRVGCVEYCKKLYYAFGPIGAYYLSSPLGRILCIGPIGTYCLSEP